MFAAYKFLPAPFPLAGVFIDTFTVFPTRTAWLGHLRTNIGAGGYSLNFLGDFHKHINMGRLISQYTKLKESHTVHT
jgi:hypothetical protein